MRYTVSTAWLLFWLFSSIQTDAQSFSLRFQPVFQQKNVILDAPLLTVAGDSLALHTLRLYLCNFVFLKKGATVWAEENSHHLLDLEDANTLNLRFDLPAGARFDEVKFDLGVDSLTNASGALGGDLDPTKGMYWTWQSGYINVKIEGFFERCPTRDGEFQFHLGGYLPPFPTVQTIKVGRVLDSSDLQIRFDLAPFFEKVDWAKKYSIMSPGAAAAAASRQLAGLFEAF